MLGQQLTQTLSADHHHPSRVVDQVAAQLADAPVGERATELLRSGLGRLHDERLVVSRYPAGTATRPLGVQARHAHLVEPVDHLTHPILRRLHQTGDHRHRVVARRRLDHQRPPIADHARLSLALTPTHEPLQLAALLVGEPSHTHWFSHTESVTIPISAMVDPSVPVWSGH